MTSVQSSVFLILDDEDLSFLEPDEDEECFDDLVGDILEGSLSVSEPDWVLALPPFRCLLRLLFPDERDDGAGSLLSRGVGRSPKSCPAASSQSSCAPRWSTCM